MTGNEEQKRKEELLSRFIDELNQEKKPSTDGLDMEENQELYRLFDTVMAVKRLKDEEIPETPSFKVYNKRNKWKDFLKHGAAIAACLLIVVAAALGSTGTKDGSNGSGKNTSEVCVESENQNRDNEAYTDNKAEDDRLKQKNGSSEDLTAVYTSCSAAATLLGGLPEGLQINSAVKLENSPYTYRVSCSWDKINFMDIYILPGVNGYDMDYQSNCYSFMDGIIEDNTDAVSDINEYYGEAVSTLSWSGDGFTITIVSDRGCDEVRSMLEKITGSKAVPLSEQVKDK